MISTLSKVFLGLFSCFLFISGCSSPSSNPSGCAVDESTCQEDEASQTQNLSADFDPMSFEEAIAFFEDKQSGLLYFGFPNCPFCQEIVPILHTLASQANIPVHYIQTRDDQGIRLYTDSQRDEIAPYLQDYIHNNSEGEPTLYVPLVVAVEEGKVVGGHQGTIQGHNAHEQDMTAEQKQEVQEDLYQLISVLSNQK